METNHYEVVVCGPDFPGLVTAALIARRGYRVLLCGHDRAPASFTAAGHTLARKPGALPAVDAEPALRVLRELNYVPIVRRRAPASFPGVQFLLPGLRFELPPGDEALRLELARAFPQDAAVIEAGLVRAEAAGAALDPLFASDVTLPPAGFWDRREVARVEGHLPPAGTDPLAPLPKGHAFRACFDALCILTTGLAAAELGPVARARAFTTARRGFHRLESGWLGVRALFEDKVQTFSGEIREKATPVGLVTRRGRIAGLRIGPREEIVGLDTLVWAGPVGALARLAGDKAPKRLRELADTVRPAYYRYTLCAIVRPGALPGAWLGARAVAIADPTRPPLEENGLLVTTGINPRDPDAICLWVECLVPAAALAGGTGYLALVRARVRERLGALLPFMDLGRNLVVLASPHDGLAPERPFRDELDGPLAPVPAFDMEPVASCDVARALEVGGAPHDVGLKNVLLASAEVLPGVGAEGDYVTAQGAARLLQDLLPRRDHRRRGILIRDT